MTPARRLLLTLTAIALTATAVTAFATARMKSERIADGVCKTMGGGKFVAIPGFPGEKIDRRLLKDVKWMVRKYKIFVTDGFSTDPVHSANGEHPVGLALDIIPDRSRGGTWRLIGRLARKFEPSQNQVRAPFRWVGYNGDANHGRGHHLHLSWNHGNSKFGKPAKTVYSVKCPGGNGGSKPAPEPAPEPTPEPGKGGIAVPDGGGTSPDAGSKRKQGSGGIGATSKRQMLSGQSRPSSAETDGVGIGD